MPEPTAPSTPVCLLLTVGSVPRGKGPDPALGLVQVLQTRRPARFLLFPTRSRDSVQTAERVLAKLDREARQAFEPWSATQPFLLIERHDNPAIVRAALAEAIRAMGQRLPASLIVVNAASGTKQMAVGAALAALEAGAGQVEFGTGSGNENADPAGRRRTNSFDAARWRAEQDAAAAIVSWDNQFLAAAARQLDAASSLLVPGDSLRNRLAGLARAAAGLAAKEDCRFAEAEDSLREALRTWPTEAADPSPPADNDLVAQCRKLAERCGRFKLLQEGKRDSKIQRELQAEIIDHSLRAAQAGRFEEAAQRLHRAMEMDLQIRLHDLTDGVYWNGRLRGRDVPAPLRAPAFLTTIQRTEAPREFSFDQMVHALHALGDTSLDALHADLAVGRHESTFRAAAEIRHGSILAHGCAPVTKADYRNLRRAATRFLALAIAESNPLPAFDRRWLAGAP